MRRQQTEVVSDCSSSFSKKSIKSTQEQEYVIVEQQFSVHCYPDEYWRVPLHIALSVSQQDSSSLLLESLFDEFSSLEDGFLISKLPETLPPFHDDGQTENITDDSRLDFNRSGQRVIGPLQQYSLSREISIQLEPSRICKSVGRQSERLIEKFREDSVSSDFVSIFNPGLFQGTDNGIPSSDIFIEYAPCVTFKFIHESAIPMTDSPDQVKANLKNKRYLVEVTSHHDQSIFLSSPLDVSDTDNECIIEKMKASGYFKHWTLDTLDDTKSVVVVQKQYPMGMIPEFLLSFKDSLVSICDKGTADRFPLRLVLNSAIRFLANAVECADQHFARSREIPTQNDSSIPHFSNEVKEQSHLDEWGRFTMYKDHRVRCVFNDRTVLELDRQAAMCKILDQRGEMFHFVIPWYMLPEPMRDDAQQTQESLKSMTAMEDLTRQFSTYVDLAIEFRHFGLQPIEARLEERRRLSRRQQVIADVLARDHVDQLLEDIRKCV